MDKYKPSFTASGDFFFEGEFFVPLRNSHGVALVTAIIVSLIGLLMLASLLFVTRSGLWTSGSQRRYQVALESAYGGMLFWNKEIIQRGINGTNLGAMGNYGGILSNVVINNANFNTKLTTTGFEGDGTYPVSNPADATLTFTFPPPNANVLVNASIRSTSSGNSSSSTNSLISGGVVSNNSGTITPQQVPYIYQTAFEARSVVGLQEFRERADVLSLYVY